ncbi:hypothetical protein [uncultured Paracoccus sp.]|uniref:hypothetical protein n=1 Tax=uncultured Paracoccus sp. TaxID=189685 RepID=UPI002633A998|nr:hypothetical protein [uncultured Paracoccus sp.]
MIACGLRPAGYSTLPKAKKAEHLRFSDMRGMAVTMLSVAGSKVPQIASITGHTLQSAYPLLEEYLAMTPALSQVAILVLENSPATAFANQLQTGPQGAVHPKSKVKGDY